MKIKVKKRKQMVHCSFVKAILLKVFDFSARFRFFWLLLDLFNRFIVFLRVF